MNVKKNSIAVRSETIIEARFSLTAKQNELLDMLMCEIKDDKQYQYTISVEKYRDFYKTDSSNLYRDLKSAVKSFEGKGFRIINKETNEEIYYAWFSKIHYIPKTAEIKLNLDLDFKKILWEVRKKIYYDIRYTLNFDSGYSQRMYYYLKSFEDTGWRIDNIDMLLKKLECPVSYKNFSDFKRNVLNISEKEINSTSDISFTYETYKTGRKITNIKFYVSKKDKKNIKSIIEPKEIDDMSTQLVSDVRNFIKEDISDKDILVLLNLTKNNINTIKEKYDLMKRQKHVDNIMAWLKSAINKDYKSKVSFVQQSAFNNFEGRNYSKEQIDDIENKLLGCK